MNTKEWMKMEPYKTGAPAPYSEWRDISPETAQNILDSMVRNRPIRWAAVERYANDMRRGDWNKYASEISVDPDGHLINGQHRMLAVIRADMTVPFSIKFNVPPDTPFDIGVPRMAKDDLTMRGNLPPEHCTKNVVSIANMVIERAIGTNKYRSLSNTDRERFLTVYGEECALSNDITRTGHNGGCRLASVQAGAFAALLCGVPEETLREFFQIATSGYPKCEEQFAAVTLNKILEKNKRFNGAADRALKQSSTEQAIKDFIKGVPRQRAYQKTTFPYSDKIAERVREVLA